MVRLCNFTSNKKCFPVPYSESQLKVFFKQHDADGDGFLTKQELRNAFNHLGSSNPRWRAFRALHIADQNGDGQISIEDELEEVIKYALKRGYKMGCKDC